MKREQNFFYTTNKFCLLNLVIIEVSYNAFHTMKALSRLVIHEINSLLIRTQLLQSQRRNGLRETSIISKCRALHLQEITADRL